MKRVITTLCLVGVVAANASDPVPVWRPSWNVELHRLYCELQRHYVIPRVEDPNQRGILNGTKYYGAWVQFRVPTRQQGNVISAADVDRMQFWLTLSEDPRIQDETRAVTMASIDEFEASRFVAGPAHVFSLAEESSNAILRRLVDEEPVMFTLEMANGESREFEMPGIPPGYFRVYAAMFETCVRENRD